MKSSSRRVAAAALIFLLLLPSIASSRHIGRPRFDDHPHRHLTPPRMRRSPEAKADSDITRRPAMRPRGPDTLQVAGSSLPDCSHACGSCTPCRLVMVSFVCATLDEAETCPMAYKCMCKNKSYPVP
ncbi:hypothetical protein Nepgr_013916 [Nepenthes gracilis]|uniref:Epidermal patterning factor-like protein n=1 Tax=Nepenthes gracilis TaxID=150966 RepID=A0AAD3XPW1_NEPGR|nr:hypothetical protein Nepgr_013916 [Nepenthes gracilis]